MITDPIEKAVIRAKVRLLLTQPFFGTMATGLEIILTNNTNHTWCKTAATDGRRLYMNRDFVASMTEEELLFVVAHEVMHVVYDHITRRKGRDPEYYNMAGDYVINYTLVKNNIGKMPPVGLFSDKYTDEMTSEEVYEDLKKNQAKIQMPLDQHLDGKGKAKGNDGKGGSTDGDEDSPGNGEGGKIQIDVDGDGDGPPILSQEELDEIRAEVLSRTIQAAQAAQSKGAGCIPHGVKRMISELTEAKLDWRTMIDTHVRSQQKCDYTLTRLSRVDIGGGFIFPAEDDDLMVELDCVIDTSGSMSAEMLREICSEIKGIMLSFPDFKLRLCSFDTSLYDYGLVYTPQNIDEIDNYTPKGGGGTDLQCYWDQLKDEGRIPERVVVFTDGYLYGGWGEANYADVLWIFYGGNREKAPYGQTCYYDDAK